MSYTATNAFIAGSNAIATNGTTLGHSATLGGTYTIFAEIKKISTAKTTVGKAKVTNMQSPNATHEYIPGYIEPCDYEFDANMTDADNVAIRALIRVKQFFKIVFANAVVTAGTTRTFQGWVSEVSEETEPDKEVTHKIKITVTGSETVTAAV